MYYNIVSDALYTNPVWIDTVYSCSRRSQQNFVSLAVPKLSKVDKQQNITLKVLLLGRKSSNILVRAEFQLISLCSLAGQSELAGSVLEPGTLSRVQLAQCTIHVLCDCQDCHIGRPFWDAWNKLLWRDKTCPALST